ncbi:ion transporter [Microbacterium sp. kSW2-24]|jgi:voltage-gated sodium channel|uniref:ion transporter n=1 Tax=Microbacterium galbinum TaxID=2851646 RepID=UPI001FFD4D6F|nr:ion transporter [Microbacterium galbinum]MCK2024461.1 ion transporter [Microbacterium galbinum]
MRTDAWHSRAAVGRFVLSSPVQTFIIVVILVNAVILGLETSPAVTESFGGLLHVLDKICLGIFLIEIALKLYAERLGFFRNAWNVFDFLVIGVALIPGADGFAVLRALRVLRVLRLISVIPSLRRVVDALVRAVPGIVSIAALLVIVFYVGAVMSTMLFGARFPEYFGDMGASLFSLFQIMTLDSWSAIARTVSAEIPWAPAFFVPFVLISALTVLNLFIAVIVDAMQGLDEDRVRNGEAPVHEVTVGGHGEAAVLAELRELRAQVAQLTQSLESGARPARE